MLFEYLKSFKTLTFWAAQRGGYLRGAKPCVFTRFLSGVLGAATFSKCSVFGRVNYATSEARLRSFGFGVPRIEAEPQDFNTHFVGP